MAAKNNKFIGREKSRYGDRLIGVVEDRFDPLEAGRYKVRWYGWNKKDKDKSPTEFLAWSMAKLPTDRGKNNTPYIFEGTQVSGYFIDGPNGQFPIIDGIISGVPEREADPSVGFFDPRPDSLLEGHKVPREPDKLQQHDDGSGNDIFEQKKKSRFPDKKYLKEPNIPRLARGVTDGTVIERRKADIAIGQTDIPTADHPPGTGTDVASPGTEWTERESGYKAKYPYNEVYFSEGGHTFEIDNTPNHERIHEAHRVGTFREIGPLGEIIQKVVDDKFDIVLKSLHQHIEASRVETVDWFKKTYVNKDAQAGFNYDITVGPNGDLNITTEKGKLNINVKGSDHNVKVEGDWTVEVDKNANILVHEDANIKVEKNCYLTVDQNLHAHVGETANIEVDGDCALAVHSNFTGNVDGNYFMHVGGNYQLTVNGNIYEQTGGNRESISTANTDFWAANVSVLAEGLLNLYATNISEGATNVINQVAGAAILRGALVTITDEAPLISHNAAVTNCTGALTGITVDDDGDVTPAGPPGVSPSGTATITPTIVGIRSSITAITASIPIAIQYYTNLTNTIRMAVRAVVDAFSNLTDAQADNKADANDAVAANPNAPGAAGAGSGSGSGGSKNGQPIDAPQGFLYKPTSDSNGNLVVLLPSGERADSITITEPNGNSETATYSGVANGGRQHGRFSKPGNSYAPGSTITYNDTSVTVTDTNQRYEGNGVSK